ncbi:carbohydrate ABC transporter ATP-binding protein, CUT1 family [Tistlia consotensis]|uniref:Carbohydrate ABC transporter ATP-binding protein, CUT1 family n=1 Tax=Tistlia consotensis USBA 355 TaxID=560819 RepID=A0A1Y6CKR3_9PROT|nr:ABC transporter ATP-binding protein [Tistlia consotensis]SMF73610.1 carbohydrate ABC transporter ATP-binding protein, CUT1 family [Tistlia consotensis USBA 355]SNS28245.1 carbohydrate ABC transporter ATP-binding protein, CUT1 family [Tistlia consotensis]
MGQAGNCALSLAKVGKSYGSVRALDNLSFNVAEGRFFVLFGPSSVGKTTTLRTIAGLVAPDRGRVEIFGRDWTRAPIAGRGVSMVFQSFALYPHLSVYDNFAYPLVEERVPRSEIDRRVRETAAMLRLEPKLDRRPGTLSGGEQQRVALGRSLIRRPRILLLDEPLTNLDAKLRHDMRAELKRLHRQFGLTVVYATPDELEALSMGEEIAVMRDGGIVQIGTPDQLYETPRDLYVAGKIGSPHMNLIRGTLAADGAGLACGIGALPFARRLGGAAAGEAAVVGIRPSDIRLAGDGESGLAARIAMLEPLGDITVVSVEAGGATLRMVLPESAASSLAPGQAASVVLDPARFHVFRASSGQAIT